MQWQQHKKIQGRRRQAEHEPQKRYIEMHDNPDDHEQKCKAHDHSRKQSRKMPSVPHTVESRPLQDDIQQGNHKN